MRSLAARGKSRNSSGTRPARTRGTIRPHRRALRLPGRRTLGYRSIFGSYIAPEGIATLPVDRPHGTTPCSSGCTRSSMANVHGEELDTGGGDRPRRRGERRCAGHEQQRETRCSVKRPTPRCCRRDPEPRSESRATDHPSLQRGQPHHHRIDGRDAQPRIRPSLHRCLFSGSRRRGELASSVYASIRDLSTGTGITEITDYDEYLANHRWYIQEIAAED